MKCNKCQHALPDDSAFCQYCGNLVVAEFASEEEKTADVPAMPIEKAVVADSAVPAEPVHMDLPEAPKTSCEEQPEEPMNIPEQPESKSKAEAVSVPEEAFSAPTDITIKEKSSVSASEPNRMENRISPVVPKTSKTTYCRKCGGQINPVTKKCTKCETQYFNAKKLPIIITSAFLTVFFILSIFLFVKNIALIKQTEEMESTINSLNDEIAEKNDEMKSLQSKANYYDDILKALRTGSIGRASASFSASDSVILMNKNTTDRKFTLYTTWTEGGGTISVDHAGTSAVVSFDNNTWYDSTTLTVIPKQEGITAVTFSNDLNPDTFTVLIIVVP